MPQDLKHVPVLPAARARDIDSEPDLVGQAQCNVCGLPRCLLYLCMARWNANEADPSQAGATARLNTFGKLRD